MSCPNCSKEHKRSKTGLCATCYMKAYRSTPNGHKRSLDAIKRYQKKNPEKRFKHVVRYRERTGYYVPLDLHLLRTAAKTLERTLAAAENGSPVSKSSEYYSNQSIKRRNRFGDSSTVLLSDESFSPIDFRRGDKG
jgi:hypothetical protein